MIALPESALELLQRPSYGHVVTLNADGSPQLTMVWAHVEGGRPVFSTAADRLKARNLRRDPRITLSVQDPDHLQQYLLLRGRAELMPDDGDTLLDALARKFLGRDRYPNRRPEEERVAVYVDVEHIGGSGPWVDGA